MRRQIALGLLLGLWAANGVHAQEYAVGADLSGLKQAEDRGFVFKDNNVPKPGLQIFKDHGYNWIRLRLFHTPTMAQNLQYTIALAQAAKKLGFKFLLNYRLFGHVGGSRTPGHSEGLDGTTHGPRWWRRCSSIRAIRSEHCARPASCRTWSRSAMKSPTGCSGRMPNFRRTGTISPTSSRPVSHGVEAGKANLPRPRIMIHIDKGGDKVATKSVPGQARDLPRQL